MSIAEKKRAKGRAPKKEPACIIGAIILLVLVSISVVLALRFRESALLGGGKPSTSSESGLAELDNDAPSLDELLSKLQQSYEGELYSGDGIQIFANYVYEEANDGHITFNRAYQYFDEMAPRIEDGQAKLSYCAKYANIYYSLNREADEAAAVFQNCQPESSLDPQHLAQYYSVLRSLYQTAGNFARASDYNNLAMQAAPEAARENNTGDSPEEGEE